MEDTQKNFLSEMDLQADDQARLQLMETAKWSKFISITMFVFAGLILIGGVLGGAVMEGVLQQLGTRYNSLLGQGGAVIIIIAVLAAVVFAGMYYFLFSFAQKIKNALLSENTEELNGGLKMLKTFFIISTVLAIAGLLINIVNFF
jgi:hypothetical protein